MLVNGGTIRDPFGFESSKSESTPLYSWYDTKRHTSFNDDCPLTKPTSLFVSLARSVFFRVTTVNLGELFLVDTIVVTHINQSSCLPVGVNSKPIFSRN